MFWEALRGLDPVEQTLFVNFCSGRSRLPAAASDFPMPFTLTTPPPTSTEHPDRFLPVARTCFFSLSLPKYTSVGVCREKLRYAIRHTDVMDADFVDRRGASAWDQLPTAATAVNNIPETAEQTDTVDAPAAASAAASTAGDDTAESPPSSSNTETTGSTATGDHWKAVSYYVQYTSLVPTETGCSELNFFLNLLICFHFHLRDKFERKKCKKKKKKSENYLWILKKYKHSLSISIAPC